MQCNPVNACQAANVKDALKTIILYFNLRDQIEEALFTLILFHVFGMEYYMKILKICKQIKSSVWSGSDKLSCQNV